METNEAWPEVWPIFSKVFGRLVFNALFNFFLQNKPFTLCQSGFIPGDSCVSQLLSFTHENHRSFDCHPPTDLRDTFLDITKVFNKVWYEDLIFKLKTSGVDGKFLKLLENYLTDRQQRVGQSSQQPNVLLAKYLCRCSTKFCSKATSVFNLYWRFTR